jgi:Protein of unknown function (DUF2799)
MATFTGSTVLAAIAVAGLSGCIGSSDRIRDAMYECTRENGFDLGETGAAYKRGCPIELEADFQAAYKDGHALFVAEGRVAELELAITKRSARIEGMQHDVQHSVDALVAPDTATADRLFLLERARALSEEQGRLQAEIDRLNAEVAVKRAQLESLRHTLAQVSVDPTR